VTDGAGTDGAVSDRPVVIGLTGPIGCGKSTIAGWLAERGATVIDADAVARAVTAPGAAAHDEVLATFGDAVRAVDGTLDRAALGRIVFADPARLAELEAIVHPAVRQQILRAMDEAATSSVEAIVVEAIKLVEGGLAELCDEVWLVTCEPGTQRERVVERGATADDADRRIAAQDGMTERLRPSASRVIDTSGPVDDARARVASAWAEAVPSR
jgi:dephospho-CoA kinase